jgi:hypothetical protein
MKNKKWSESEIDLIKELASKGVGYSKMEDQIGRTGKAISERMQKLGYVFGDFYKKEEKECLNCGKILGRNQYKYCSSSCSAKCTNPKRAKKKTCKTCGEDFSGRGKMNSIYCSRECFWEERKRLQKEKVLNNDVSIGQPSYKKYLIDLYGAKCMECGWERIHPITLKVPIEMHHIDGDSKNNKLDNLILLCPSCHSLTPSFRGLNRGNGRKNRKG